MPFSPDIPEEQLKNEVAQSIFYAYDCTRIIGRIDFAVYPHASKDTQPELVQPHLWAEAKRGHADLHQALVQLLLTIGKARTFDHHPPPKYLGAFDCESIALLPYAAVHDIFYQNDFNWNVPPSDHESREFRQLAQLVEATLEAESLRFRLSPERKGPLSLFIQRNFNAAQATALLQIDRNNFSHVYNRWLEAVQPTIAVKWEEVKPHGIIDADFYLADILSHDNQSLLDKLNVLLQNDRYRLAEGKSQATGRMLYSDIDFNDGGQAHATFWRAYQRPPAPTYWDYILKRRDLLVPQDIRERKGSFFTPQIWVQKSQEYLTAHLGLDWQDRYYIWDCAAGTGNLLAGLTNRNGIWASTLDQADVDVMHERIERGANLYHNHVFQFDFLNDPFEKLPDGLRQIVEDPEKRKRLVVYINPPYAEGDARIGHGRSGVHKSKIHERYHEDMGDAARELFAQFLFRVYREIPNCVLASFSTLKSLQAPKFRKFRGNYRAKLEKVFLVPADTFDNVKGQFPISFSIWNTSQAEPVKGITANVYNHSGEYLGEKSIIAFDEHELLAKWLSEKGSHAIDRPWGRMASVGSDFHNQSNVFIENVERRKKRGGRHTLIGGENLIIVTIFFALRHCIPATWLNNQDQFLWPSDAWLHDPIFQSDCLAYTLFHRKNRISHTQGENHWIPYTEDELGLKESLASHFLTDFMHGRLPAPTTPTLDLFTANSTAAVELEAHAPAEPRHPEPRPTPHPYPTGQTPLTFSPEAQALLDAGRKLWKYYLSQPGVDINASFYDIRAHFQGRKANGDVKSTSSDPTYTQLYAAIQDARSHLGDQCIAPKIYEYGFLAK